MTVFAPTTLPPVWRYVGDDWAGPNSLTMTVYQTAPVFGTDGVTEVTPGVPKDLTGYTVSGLIIIRATGQIVQAPTGALVNPTGGLISLSVPQAQTQFQGQALSDFATPALSLLIVRFRVKDVSNNVTTVGVLPLFVF